MQTEILLIIQSKLWGMLHGINLAKEKWYRNLEIHSHANDAIQMVKGLANPNQHEKLILDAIKASIMPAMTVQFSHVYRECNKVADLLAKKGLSLDEGIVYFLDILGFVVSAFHADIVSLG